MFSVRFSEIFLLIFSIFIRIASAQQPLLPFGFTNLFFKNTNIQKALQKVSPQCGWETGEFFNSIFQSSKIIESCRSGDFCVNELEEHMFALKQLDASGKIPSGISEWMTASEGNYAACNAVDGERYPTDYCYLQIVPGKNSSCPIDEISEQVKIKIAMCIPQSCTSQDIVQLFNELTPFPARACQTFCVKTTEPLSFWFWIFSFCLIGYFSFCIGATAVDLNWTDKKSMDEKWKIISCFSFYSNFKFIFEQKNSNLQVKGLDFLKFWTLVWVIVGHSPISFAFGDTVKALLATKFHLLDHLVLDAMYSVQTFFVIGGTLLGYNIFMNHNYIHNISSPTQWLKIFIRRYIRLLTPLIPWIGVVIFSGRFIRGPAIASIDNYVDVRVQKCTEWWWMNLLMLQNYQKPINNCYPISWYVAADFQLLLLSPILLIPLVTARRQSAKFLILIVISSFLYIFWAIWMNNLSPFYYTLVNLEEYIQYLHQSVFPRIPTFLIGILLGKNLAIHKKPTQVLQKNEEKCWILAFFAIFISFYGKLLVVREVPDYNFIFSGLHYIFHEQLWNALIVWVIYACQHNLGPKITRVICAKYWQPLGKLTFCIYIVHFWVNWIVVNMPDRILHFISMKKMILDTSIPILLISTPLALVWSSMFEVPVTRMEKLWKEKSLRVC